MPTRVPLLSSKRRRNIRPRARTAAVRCTAITVMPAGVGAQPGQASRARHRGRFRIVLASGRPGHPHATRPAGTWPGRTQLPGRASGQIPAAVAAVRDPDAVHFLRRQGDGAACACRIPADQFVGTGQCLDRRRGRSDPTRTARGNRSGHRANRPTARAGDTRKFQADDPSGRRRPDPPDRPRRPPCRQRYRFPADR